MATPHHNTSDTEKFGRYGARYPRLLEHSGSTAVESNVRYRLEKLQGRGILHGDWLDYGCADGGYTLALADRGATRVVGVDVEEDRIRQAKDRVGKSQAISFHHTLATTLALPSNAFDGVLVNEVLEHVDDEVQTLSELHRVLRPNGYLALISPNRWFPFEGHGMVVAGTKIGFPIPFLPWIPSRISGRFMLARNYWPSELRDLVVGAGFEVLWVSPVLPVFEVYPWLPSVIIRWYRSSMPLLERLPLFRRFGVSTLILARKSALS